jgi:hypothetical protein
MRVSDSSQRWLLFALRAQEEAEARRAAEREAALAARRARSRAALKPEPSAGTAGTTTLRVRLPNGSNHLRKFLSSNQLQVRTWHLSCAPHSSASSRAPHQLVTGTNPAALGRMPVWVPCLQGVVAMAAGEMCIGPRAEWNA